jgi:hypothetical protein
VMKVATAPHTMHVSRRLGLFPNTRTRSPVSIGISGAIMSLQFVIVSIIVKFRNQSFSITPHNPLLA